MNYMTSSKSNYKVSKINLNNTSLLQEVMKPIALQYKVEKVSMAFKKVLIRCKMIKEMTQVSMNNHLIKLSTLF